jgi:hypothetical protein
MFGRIEKRKLIIEITLQKPTPSLSGKTLIVATSHGPRRSSAKVDGKPVIVVANAYIHPEKVQDRAKKTENKLRKGASKKRKN